MHRFEVFQLFRGIVDVVGRQACFFDEIRFPESVFANKSACGADTLQSQCDLKFSLCD